MRGVSTPAPGVRSAGQRPRSRGFFVIKRSCLPSATAGHGWLSEGTGGCARARARPAGLGERDGRRPPAETVRPRHARAPWAWAAAPAPVGARRRDDAAARGAADPAVAATPGTAARCRRSCRHPRLRPWRPGRPRRRPWRPGRGRASAAGAPGGPVPRPRPSAAGAPGGPVRAPSPAGAAPAADRSAPAARCAAAHGAPCAVGPGAARRTPPPVQPGRGTAPRAARAAASAPPAARRRRPQHRPGGGQHRRDHGAHGLPAPRRLARPLSRGRRAASAARAHGLAGQGRRVGPVQAGGLGHAAGTR